MFEIRPLAPAEFARLCVAMPMRARAQHWSNLNRQQAGELLYLIAWEGERAVGQVLLYWRPAHDPVATLASCPWVVDLVVHPDWRSRGAGSALLRACEEAALAHGQTHIGLGVAIGNTRARALYERLGYHHAGLDDQQVTGAWEDASGRTHIWEDRVTYLIKSLATD